jgi:hypothetical protein
LEVGTASGNIKNTDKVLSGACLEIPQKLLEKGVRMTHLWR